MDCGIFYESLGISFKAERSRTPGTKYTLAIPTLH